MPRTTIKLQAAASLALFAAPSLALAGADAQRQAAERVSQMVRDRDAQLSASEHDLNIVNVLWEDTGRFQGSALGPNISDVTIEVETEREDGQKNRHLMPVLRYPNFSDKTADVDLDEFYLRVGNESGDDLTPVSLRDYLDEPETHLNLEEGGEIEGGSLLADRDEHVLVSAQHAFLPIRQGADTRFWPAIFNYQSRRDHPAVLTILATRQGTSATIIDNSRNRVSGGRGQRLFFNDDGERAPLLAERLSDVMERGETANEEDADSLGEDANVLFLIQVPLQFERPRRQGPPAGVMMESADGAPAARSPTTAGGRGDSDVETAVLGHGESEGPFTDLDGLSIERDPDFPVRVTAQFYQATSNGVVSPDDIGRMAGEIEEIYDLGDAVGSLVLPDEDDLERTTNWTGVMPRPAGLSLWDFPGLIQLIQDYSFDVEALEDLERRPDAREEPGGMGWGTPAE